ncbi:RNA pyrophosphohydrolase [Bartonella sp. B30(2025)]
MDEIINFEALPYRKCVGILVFNREGKVWIGRRVTVHTTHVDTEVSDCWQLPQGGIDDDEEPLDAARRELYEETGIRSVTLLKEAKNWFQYDFPQEFAGRGLSRKYRGQRQKWFAFQFTGEISEIAINPPPDGNTAEFDKWRWIDLEALPLMIISFKKQVYIKVVNEFRDSFKHL